MAIIDAVKYQPKDNEYVFKFPSEDLRIGTQVIVKPALIFGVLNLLLNTVLGFLITNFVLAVISFILAIFSPNKIQDNYFLVGFLFILLFQITLYSLIKSLYSKGKK